MGAVGAVVTIVPHNFLYEELLVKNALFFQGISFGNNGKIRTRKRKPKTGVGMKGRRK